MTPLEMAVWAATYVHSGPTYPIEHADNAVIDLRARLEAERQKERLDEAKTLHQIRIVTSKRSGVELQTVRCSCGYEPPPMEGYDPDDMMALHLGHVRALGTGDVPR